MTDYTEEIVQFDENGDGVITGQLVRCGECINQPGCQFAQYQGNSGYCSLGERRDNNG